MMWRQASEAESYTLEYATNNSFTQALQTVDTIPDTTLQVSGLVNGTIYYWRVHGVNEADSGEWSPIWSYKTIGAITITVPNGGELWERGTTNNITWTDSIDEKVKIALNRGGAIHLVITDSTESSGQYTWSIPVDIEPFNDYTVTITSIADTVITDISDAVFSITTPQIFATLIPNGLIWGSVKVYVSVSDVPTHEEQFALVIDQQQSTYSLSEIGSDGTTFQSGVEFNNYKFADGPHIVKVLYRNIEVASLAITTGQLYPHDVLEYCGLFFSVVEGSGHVVFYAPDSTGVMSPPLWEHKEPFSVSLENSGKVRLTLHNPYGAAGALLRLENGCWTLCDYSKQDFTIQETSTYVICRDSNFEIVPRISTESLGPNFPNPFNQETVIPFTIAESGMVRILIYDVRGRMVRELVNEPKNPGIYTVRWDGSDMDGRQVTSGIYLTILEVGGKRITNKMAVIRLLL